MLHDSSIAGPHDPRPPVVARRPGSVRRTTTIDTRWPEGFDGPAHVDARGRDLLTRDDSTGSVVADARFSAVLTGRAHRIRAFETNPPVAGLDELVGVRAGPGFRARIYELLPDLRSTGALLYFLLDELPGASLVSGYALLHADRLPIVDVDYQLARADLCAGWVADGSMMRLIRDHAQQPTPIGPEALPVEGDDDPIGFHEIEPVGPDGMRRLRRLDVATDLADPSAPFDVDVFFRDSHVDHDGRETVLHEYSVVAALDVSTRTLLRIEARADVLPWRECPGALDSATRLLGRPLDDLRSWVRQTFVGTSTCTHLNDVLRGLADLQHLADLAAGAAHDSSRGGNP